MNCIFCKIVDGQIPSYKVYEDEYTMAFLDINPNSDGHCVVIPKQHVDSFSTANETIVMQVAKAKLEIVKIYQKTLNPAGFNYVSNDGSEAFQEVFHYHEHIIPKYIKDEGYTFVIKPTELSKVEDVFNKIKAA